MYRRCAILLLALAALPVRAGEILDRLVATVNGHVILQSDWNEELRYESLMSGRLMRDLTPEYRRAALERLIDQELLREQMAFAEFKPATSEQIQNKVDELKKSYARDHGAASWEAALSSYSMTESDVSRHIATELNSLRVIDSRLRPSVQIDSSAVQDYYRNELSPKFGNGARPSLREAAPQIRELLIQQKINESLTAWLQTLRSQAQIRIVDAQSSAQVQP